MIRKRSCGERELLISALYPVCSRVVLCCVPLFQKVTNRRVNALENVTIPRMEAVISYINRELDELERWVLRGADPAYRRTMLSFCTVNIENFK